MAFSGSACIVYQWQVLKVTGAGVMHLSETRDSMTRFLHSSSFKDLRAFAELCAGLGVGATAAGFWSVCAVDFNELVATSLTRNGHHMSPLCDQQ